MTAVLYLTASPGQRDDVIAAARAGSLALEVVTDVATAVARTIASHFDAVLIDAGAEAGLSLIDGFLSGHAAERDRELRFRRDRILALVVGDGAVAEATIFELGRRRIGGYLRGAVELTPLVTTAVRPPASRKALCAAGGGITGVYYELGVLKCLEDVGFAVHDFDLNFGISAGAIITSLIANRVALVELIHQMDPSNRDGFDLELRLRHLTFRDLPRRAAAVVDHLRDYRDRVERGEERLGLTAALSQLAALAGPFFRGDTKARQLHDILTRPGRTDDFRDLKRELYIGATDQDTREHVLFGAEPFRHVPISQAVQASAAIHPFLASVEIDGRRYTDGFVTRTTNIAAAVERGANLVVVVDPFLPLIAETPGFNDRHSLFWVLVQDYKTVSFTRYERVSTALLDTHPGVACIAFLPSNRMRRLLASSPISTNNFDAIITQAYASTYRRVHRIASRLGPVLADHGIELTLEAAARRTALLDALPIPRAAALCT